MLSITANNVNDAFESALYLMKAVGIKEQTRNGEVMSAPEPVATTYKNPTQRMLFSAKRDANPFFHIMEGIWMLSGSNEVDFPARFASNIANYSDDGIHLNGAYGYRWRQQYPRDQIKWVIDHLNSDPLSRRAVLTMWDPEVDMEACNKGSKDVPCNTTIYFRVVDNALDMTVCNRSNDIVWGCYGANVVHMSMLHEYIANALGWPIGKYVHISNNWHIYSNHYHFLANPIQEEYPEYDHFGHIELTTPNWVSLDKQEFKDFVGGKRSPFNNRWLRMVGVPIIVTHELYKSHGVSSALEMSRSIGDQAIRYACSQWLERRVK